MSSVEARRGETGVCYAKNIVRVCPMSNAGGKYVVFGGVTGATRQIVTRRVHQAG